MSQPLTHFDAQGQAHMVDVAAKAETHRVARATGSIRMLPGTLALISSGEPRAAALILAKLRTEDMAGFQTTSRNF